MNRIASAFARGKAFVAFVTAGDPDLETTARLIVEMAEAGADVVEIGIPFSDPTAEGPVIMQANLRALAGGVTTEKILETVAAVRDKVSVPLVFMTYANVVFSYGSERFMRRAREAGVDGLVVADLPFEERQEFLPYCQKYGLELISFVAPTSEERVRKIVREATGYIYLVSSLGVTGARSAIGTDVGAIVATIRETTDVPVAVGFGIATPQAARAMARVADGVITGSAIVELVGRYGRESVKPVGAFVRQMKKAVSEA